MDSKLKGFFDTAQQKAAEVTTAQQAAADAEARRKAALEAKMDLLRGQIDEELGPILDVLRALPPKDSKQFFASISEGTSSRDTEARYDIYVSYIVPRNPRSHSSFPDEDDYDRERPAISLEITRKENGALDIAITQYSIVEKDPADHRMRHRSLRVKDFETARKELGLGLGTFAADRMAEIGAALGATSSTPAAPPSAEDDKIGVFKQPLRLKGNTSAVFEAQASAADKKPDAPVEKFGAEKKPFWKRFGFG